jgi:hypothetical protein
MGHASVTQTYHHDDLDVGDATKAGLGPEVNGPRSELATYQPLRGVVFDLDLAVVVSGIDVAWCESLGGGSVPSPSHQDALVHEQIQ